MEPDITIPPDARLLEIATSLQAASSEMERLKSLILSRLDPSLHQQFEANWSDAHRATQLATRYQREFQESLNDRYGEPMLVSVERIIGDAASVESKLGKSLSQAREATRSSRRNAGRWFVGWGIALILSNLVVIPAMAWFTSNLVEHPAAAAVRSLEEYLRSPPRVDTGEAGIADAAATMKETARALTSIQAIAGHVARIEGILASGDFVGVEDLPAYESFARLHDAILQLPSESTGGEFVDRHGDEDVRTAHDASRTIELIGSSMAVYQRGDPERIRFSGSDRWHDANEFVVLKKSVAPDELEMAVQEMVTLFGTLNELGASTQRHQSAVAELELVLQEIRQPLGEIMGESMHFGDVGRELEKLQYTVHTIATKLQVAVETLASTATFVTPYAFAVLAIGAMFVSIGVASLLRSLRVRDDSYDEAVELNRTFMLGRLACVLRPSHSGSHAIVERLARMGERPERSEGGMSMPLTRAVTELVEAIKRK